MAPSIFCGILFLYIHIGCVNAKCAIDVVFLVDTSNSIGASNFPKIRQFMTNSLQNFKIGLNDGRVSIVTFSDKVRENLHLSTYSNKASILWAINMFHYDGGSSTQLGKAFQYIRQNSSLATAYRDRPNVRKIVIVITDGQPNNPVGATQEANLLKQSFHDLIIVVVGVGQIFRANLNNIASNSSMVFLAANFASLSIFNDTIHSIACEGQCKDVFPNCTAAYQGSSVCTKYTTWAEVNCANYCGTCPGQCKDVAPDCKRRSQFCTNNKWMSYNCRKFCGYCRDDTDQTLQTTPKSLHTSPSVKLEPLQPVIG